MLPKEISSLQHPVVKRVVNLRTSRKTRYKEKAILLTGIKQVSEADQIEILFIERGFKDFPLALESYFVSNEILKKITAQQNPEPLAAIAKMPPFQDLKTKKRLIALDQVSDPGNVGTLLRTALALDFEGAFLTETCADPFNDKSLRAAMGATLRLPLQIGNIDDLIHLSKHFTPLVATMEGKSIKQIDPITNPLIILGSEAQGVSKELKENFQNISIPIGNIESLNVAAAGAILMYHFKQ